MQACLLHLSRQCCSCYCIVSGSPDGSDGIRSIQIGIRALQWPPKKLSGGFPKFSAPFSGDRFPSFGDPPPPLFSSCSSSASRKCKPVYCICLASAAPVTASYLARQMVRMGSALCIYPSSGSPLDLSAGGGENPGCIHWLPTRMEK